MSNRIVRALEDGARKIGKSLAEDGAKAVKDFYHSTAENLKRVAKNTAEADAKHADDLKAILNGNKDDLPREPHSPGGGGRPGTGHDETPLSEPGGPGQHSDGNGGCTTGGDPVDVVSGQMIDSATDLELPGLLPLVLSRSYASGYTGGRRFGPGWSSTLDQRVAIDDHGIHFAGDDAQILHYPLPAPGETVLPVDGARLTLSRDTNDDTVRIQDPGTGWTLHFEPVEAPGTGVRPLSALTDRNGHRIDYRYDTAGLPTGVEHSGGYRIAVDTVHTSGGPRVEALRLLDGTSHGTTVASYGYDARGRLSEVFNSSGTPLVYGYDGDDRITSWTDRNGYWYAYEYDTDGRVVRGFGADGVLDATFEYDTRNQVTTVTDSLGQSSRYHYDRFHHVTLTVDPLGGTVRTEHDRYGRLLSHTDALGRSTRFTLDAAGDTVAAERPDGSTLEFEYNSLRLPTLGRSPDGLIRRQSYDEQGNRTSSTDPSGAVTRYSHDGEGRLATITDDRGDTVRIRCNRAGLVIEAVDAQGNRTAFDYDAFGRPVAVTDPLGTTTSTWTPEGLVSTRTTAAGATESWSYDGEGNLLAHIDASGSTTGYEYAHFNQLAAVTTATGSRYSFARDRELRLTQVTDPQGLTWTYRYNAVGLPVEETDFDDRILSYSYDRAGDLASRTNGLGQTVTVERDLLGRPVARHFDGRSVGYSYDAGDRLLRAENADCVLTRAYDTAGQLTSETVNGRTISYTYDPLGRLSARRTPTGTVSTWTYDETGLPASLTVGGHTIGFTRDAAGRETHRRIGPRLDLVSDWDSENRLVSQTLTGAARREALQRRGYAYRADGSPVAATDTLTGSRQFELDRAGRVTSVHGTGTVNGGEGTEPAESYGYDPSGNLVQADWPGQREGSAKGDRVYSGTLIRSAGRTRFEHDAQGRAVRRTRTTLSGKQQSWHYIWDAEDRLTDVTTPDGARWHYLYDPVGRRIAKQRLDVAEDGSTTVAEWTDFTWSGYTLAEQTAYSPRLPGPYTQSWDYDGYRPVAQSEHLGNAGTDGASAGDPFAGADSPQDEIDRRFFAIVTDLVGAPTHLVDPDGGTAWQADATLWGLSTPQPGGSTGIPLRFPGQYYDPETHLHYNVHRYYDPATARYLTADPLGLDPAPNPYAYVVNPLTWFDPLGLAGVDENDVTWGGRVTYGARDHLHRATSVTATLHPDMMGGKTSPKFDPVGWVTGKGYNRAHLLGAQLGGSNKDPRNFVTMHQYANTPIMRDLEGQVRAAVDKGEIVKYTVTAHYSGNDLLPKGVTIEAHGNRGFQFTPRGSSSPTNSISICNRKK